MNKILVIDESILFSNYLKEKLSSLCFEVTISINGLDGFMKMHSTHPDLIIMDYYLSRKSGVEILKQKSSDKNIKYIPVIIISAKLGVKALHMIANYSVEKILSKPIKIDVLLNMISQIFKINLDIDITPCIIDVHINEKILFIEIARGFNKEKLVILKYKILELLRVYDVQKAKILVIMSNLNITEADSAKLETFFNIILQATQSDQNNMKVLTTSPLVISFLKQSSKLNNIQVSSNIEQAIEGLLGINISDFVQEGRSVVTKDLLLGGKPKESLKEELDLKFKKETYLHNIEGIKKDIIIAVVDDDQFIQEIIKTAFADTDWQIKTYTNGEDFIKNLKHINFDLIFLDIKLPKMHGFQVMSYMKEHSIDIPIIVLSVLSQRKSIIKAISFGVKSYLIKPLDIGFILKKTLALLKRDF